MSSVFDVLKHSSSVSFSDILRQKGIAVSFVSPANFYLWHKSDFLPSKINYLFVDSISLVKLLNVLDRPTQYVRQSFDFTSLAHEFFSYAQEQSAPVLVIGSTDEKNALALSNLKLTYPDIKVEGLNGYMDSDAIGDAIADFSSRHDFGFVLLSLGAPKQDMVLESLSGKFGNLTMMTSGGFIEQTSERLDYYPKLIDQLNLRWIYRVYKLRSISKVIYVLLGLAIFTRRFLSQET